MGSTLRKIPSYFSKHDEARILFLGLDAAGKTTILYVSKLGELVTTIPTIGFNVETLTYRNLTITAWDVGGRDKIRPLWRHYFQNTSGFVYVVDSNDRDRITEACEELHKMASEDDLRDVPILIFANKQDLPNAMTTDELKEKLNLSKFDKTNRVWHIQSAVAIQNQGLSEGLEWLAKAIKSKTDYTQPIVETINDSKLMTKDLLHVWNTMDIKTILSKFI